MYLYTFSNHVLYGGGGGYSHLDDIFTGYDFQYMTDNQTDYNRN